jgi:hypothetical protein
MPTKPVLRIALYFGLLAFYLASTVPVGLFLYSIKTEVGIDIFRYGGFHAYMQCLSASFPLGNARSDNAKQQTGISSARSSPAAKRKQDNSPG